MAGIEAAQIRIFPYEGRSTEGINWVLLVKGALFFVQSWGAEIPCVSRNEQISVPHLVSLPRLHILTYGTFEIKNSHAHITS